MNKNLYVEKMISVDTEKRNHVLMQRPGNLWGLFHSCLIWHTGGIVIILIATTDCYLGGSYKFSVNSRVVVISDENFQKMVIYVVIPLK